MYTNETIAQLILKMKNNANQIKYTREIISDAVINTMILGPLPP